MSDAKEIPSLEGPDHAAGLQTVAERHGVGLDAVRHLLRALERGHGKMAQFDHPDLGGLGQWFSGGMIMVGRMFDADLKARVGALCSELAASLPAGGWSGAGQAAGARGGGEWWPAGLGTPAAAGSQDGMRYAYFPESRRLAIESGGGIALYDTGEHHISGVSQASGFVGFTGPHGTIALNRLKRIEAEAAAPRQSDPITPPSAVTTVAPKIDGDIIAMIERLADLHARGVLTEREFADKKTDLLSRL